MHAMTRASFEAKVSRATRAAEVVGSQVHQMHRHMLTVLM